MNADEAPGFFWHTYNVTPLLPEGWAGQLLEVARRHAVFRMLTASSVTSREENEFVQVPSYTVDGTAVRTHSPWLYERYHNEFRRMAERFAGEPVECAKVDLYGAVLNVQSGSEMRYECHVDSNPVQGLLYVTSHPESHGGELAVARRPQAHSPKEVDEDCDVIHPVSGHLILFDGRRWPHYVRPLKHDDALRVVVAMNFYTADSPESRRPDDLSGHLFGEG